MINSFFWMFLSAVLLTLCFDPINLGVLTWVALTPGLYALYRMSQPSRAFICAYLAGYVFFAIGLSWLPHLFQWFSALLIGILALFPALFAYIMARIRPWVSRLQWFVLAPFIWTGIDYFRSEMWLLKFSWFSPGYALATISSILQWASVVGVFGLTFLVLTISSLQVAVLTDDKRQGWRHPALLTVILLLGGLWLGGRWIKPDYSTAPDRRVTLQQNESSFLPEYMAMPVDSQASLVVWPEYSSFQPLVPGEKTFAGLSSYASQKKVTLVVTAPRPFGDKSYYNTSFVIGPNGQLLGEYRKTNPVPFINDGVKGRNNIPIHTPLGKMGLAICFDADFEFVIRKQVSQGAEFIVIPTFDSEEWTFRQHRQHSAMTPLRAVENRRWILRTASSGISQIVAPDGSLTASLNQMNSGSLSGNFGTVHEQTFYTRFGWVIGPLSLGVTLLMILGIMIRERIERNRQSL